jgi:hypothetical protein
MTDTSFSAPSVLRFVWSVSTNTTAPEMVRSLISGTKYKSRRSILSPILNAQAAWNILKNSNSIKI